MRIITITPVGQDTLVVDTTFFQHMMKLNNLELNTDTRMDDQAMTILTEETNRGVNHNYNNNNFNSSFNVL